MAVLHADARVVGAVLVGSLACGDADAFSDVNAIVVLDAPASQLLVIDPFVGLRLPGVVLYRRPKPRNAPAGGAYLCVCLELAGLPVLIDLYVWPASTTAVPAGGRILVERAPLPRAQLGLLALLAENPATDDTGSDPGDPATLLMLIQLMAKYQARGDRQRQAAICRQLRVGDIGGVGELRRLLTARLAALRPASTPALAAVGRLLDLVACLDEGGARANQ